MESKTLIVIKYMVFLACIVSFSGCVPSITRVYLTPTVIGTVIDVSSLKPAANILVTQLYDKKKITSSYSDKEGKFKLVAYSEIQGVLLMVGHALKDYTLVASSQGTANQHIYDAGMRMYDEIIVSNVIVFFDSEPSVIAPPPKSDFRTTQQWIKVFKSEIFSYCNNQIAAELINQLALARKTFSHGKANFTHLAYYQVGLAWSNYRNSCRPGIVFWQDLNRELSNMNSEISAYQM